MFTGVLAIIAEAAGGEAARALARARGGARCYIPAQAREGHWLTELVGLEAAQAICRTVGGGEVEIPLNGAGTLQAARRNTRRRMAEMIRRGVPTDRIAITVGVDRSTVKRLRRKLREQERGPDLFSHMPARRRG